MLKASVRRDLMHQVRFEKYNRPKCYSAISTFKIHPLCFHREMSELTRLETVVIWIIVGEKDMTLLSRNKSIMLPIFGIRAYLMIYIFTKCDKWSTGRRYVEILT